MGGGIDRRDFLKIVSTGTVAAAAAGCGKPAEKILPYVIPPQNIVPGVASWYATVCRECPAGCGVLAKNREGRIVKVEGNPDHPVNRGALCIRGQAALQGLYDPDRIRGPLQRDASGQLKPTSWAEAGKLLAQRIGELGKQGQAGKVALVSQLETGSLAKLMDQWVKTLGTRPRLAYEPFAYESVRAANRLAFGVDAIPTYAFDQARAVLSFGADFLETWLSPVGYAMDFTRMHAMREGKVGRVIHVEPRLSLTSSNADEWVPNAPGTEAALALGILRVILDERIHPPLPSRELDALKVLVKEFDPEAVAKQARVPAETLRRLAKTFAKETPSLAVGGGVAVTGRNGTDVMVAVNLLNYVAGNIGRTVRFGPNSSLGQVNPFVEMLALTQAMARGEVGVLLLAHVNPVFTMPAKAGFDAALEKVPFVVSFSSHLDETAARAHLVLPDHTPIESWGDYSPHEGVYGLMQPGMPPVFDTRALGDALLTVGREVLPETAGPTGAFRWKTFQDYIKAQWQVLAKGLAPGVAFDTFWEESLRRGGVWRAVPVSPVKLKPEALKAPATAPALEGPDDGLALLLVPSSRYYDGRGANKAWLHETPDPMTQIVWDHWVEISTETAKRLGAAQGDLLRISSPYGSIELPAIPSEHIQPDVVAIPIGLGHTAYGRYAKGVGANPLVLLPAEAEKASKGLPWLSVRVALTRTGARRRLATPAGTTDVDHEREILETVDLAKVREIEKKGESREHAKLPSMYPDIQYPEYRWGMAIDLDSCIGCQACVVACQAENNIPIVGKEQIDYGRSLHWIRVERWWDRGEARYLPMLCQQCGRAPCEPVCPVFAAYHTDEGINGQVYNRCVGTRYCGNNCPYMVRRFNWFQYERPEPLTWQLNPDVTVREMGVMEKCTFCIQRIIAAKDQAKDEERKVRDGEVVTACQETCPTQAIVFGDLKDPNSRVSKLSRSPRGYHVLEELGTRPAITYLKKVIRGNDA